MIFTYTNNAAMCFLMSSELVLLPPPLLNPLTRYHYYTFTDFETQTNFAAYTIGHLGL